MDWTSTYIAELIERALAEDIGAGDATVAATIPPNARGQAHILAKQDLVCAGLPLAELVFKKLDPQMLVDLRAKDGQFVNKGEVLLHFSGKASAILTGERTALNFLGRLSGIATLTRRFAEQLSGTRAKIRDTRKTTPGLRLLEKYAVKMGDGSNHRIGLYDAILLKENHVALAGGVKAALDQAHAFAAAQMLPRAMTAYEAVGTTPSPAEAASLPIQIEVRDEGELREALGAGAASVLLDNMTPEEVGRCVEIARGLRADCIVEISGGITLQNARAYAETGADFLSSGALTHSAPAADVSLLVDCVQEK
ncbi:MAG TPA: carboxylating nicotinate-nucleotide diphosphorylase [Candidatus Acidoferrum sp.]|nr:carboxylating nicotinate-nucleotide diphosphorylase [Candidatus Acidoferrum sp.]